MSEQQGHPLVVVICYTCAVHQSSFYPDVLIPEIQYLSSLLVSGLRYTPEGLPLSRHVSWPYIQKEAEAPISLPSTLSSIIDPVMPQALKSLKRHIFNLLDK